MPREGHRIDDEEHHEDERTDDEKPRGTYRLEHAPGPPCPCASYAEEDVWTILIGIMCRHRGHIACVTVYSARLRRIFRGGMKLASGTRLGPYEVLSQIGF